MTTRDEYVYAKAQLRMIADMKAFKSPQPIGTAWLVAELDLQILVLEYDLEAKKIERASWD